MFGYGVSEEHPNMGMVAYICYCNMEGSSLIVLVIYLGKVAQFYEWLFHTQVGYREHQMDTNNFPVFMIVLIEELVSPPRLYNVSLEI